MNNFKKPAGYLFPTLLMLLTTVCGAAQDGAPGEANADAAEDGAAFEIAVFYNAGVDMASMLQETVASVSSPDFSVTYNGVAEGTWNDNKALGAYLVSSQQDKPVDGFMLACKEEGLEEISDAFRAEFPKVPFVDTFAPSLLAANIVSYRYLAFAGSEAGASHVKALIGRLGIGSHLRYGAGSAPTDVSLMVGYDDFDLTADKSAVIPEIVGLGRVFTGSDHTDREVINIEAIALVGCQGFLDLGVASDAQSQLEDLKIPLQVINPVKASVGLLHSLVRNKVWISS